MFFVLITVQFPLADLRPFLATETRRLVAPDWPTVRADVDFIRSFGTVLKRKDGGLEEFPGEDVFCNAARAIRFSPDFCIRADLGLGHRYCAFRRYFSDGSAVTRIEVGVGFRNRKVDDIATLLEETLALPVKIGRGPAAAPVPLLRADRPLARMILRASTKGHDDLKPPPWWIVPCEPAILVEHNLDREPVPVPARFKVIEHPAEQGMELAHGRMTFGGRAAGVWLFGIRDAHDRDYRRRLRLALLRLHAQREIVKEVLRAISADKLEVVRTKPDDPPDHPSNLLQTFLTETIARMDRGEYDGVKQSELLRAAEEMQDATGTGERAGIMKKLQPLRRYVSAAVEKFIINVQGDYVNQSINIGDNASGTFNINQVAAESITNSFNHIQGADVSPEMKAKLEDLNKLVKELMPKLPPEQQKKAAKNLEKLTEEATAKEPDREWYEVSAKGLMEAAKTVADMSGPITTAVKAVLALLVI